MQRHSLPDFVHAAGNPSLRGQKRCCCVSTLDFEPKRAVVFLGGAGVVEERSYVQGLSINGAAFMLCDSPGEFKNPNTVVEDGWMEEP